MSAAWSGAQLRGCPTRMRCSPPPTGLFAAACFRPTPSVVAYCQADRNAQPLLTKLHSRSQPAAAETATFPHALLWPLGTTSRWTGPLAAKSKVSNFKLKCQWSLDDRADPPISSSHTTLPLRD